MNPIDLTTLGAVHAWLAQAGTPVQVVNTSIAAPIAVGTQTVTPGTMYGIAVNSQLAVDNPPNMEIVNVTAVTATTFTALFQMAHAAGAPVILAMDAIIPGLITSASLGFLHWTGRGPANGSVPTESPFVQLVTYDEFYDGSGTNRLYLRNYPIVAVLSLVINNVQIPQSTNMLGAGWVIDNQGKSITMRPGGPATGMPYGYVGSYGTYLRGFGATYVFEIGSQNVEIIYTAGYQQTPWDIQQAITEIVALAVKDRVWIGHRSEALSYGGGTVTYVSPQDLGGASGSADLYVPPRARDVIEFYKRRALWS